MDAPDLRALKQLLLHLIYLLFCHLYIALQSIRRKIAKTDLIPPQHGRISSILFRRKRDPEEIGSMYDFVTSHGSFEPLSFLDGRWALYSVDQDYALLAELPYPLTHYDSKRFPFIYVPQFEEALRVAHVSLADFIAHCQELGTKPQPRTVLFTNTGRCGSTLLAQMLSIDGVSVCYAEPHVFKILSVGYHEGIYSEDFIRRILPAAINYFRKDVPVEQICVIKTTSCDTKLVPLTADVTNLQHIFMFRRNGLASMERLLQRDRAMRYLLELYKRAPLLCNAFCFRLIAGDGDFIKKLQPRNILELSAVNYASPYAHYLKNASRYAAIVWYHDLMENAKSTISALFEKLRIPPSCVHIALKRMDYDSQDGTFISRKALAGVKTTVPSAEQKARFVHYCEVMEIPKFILLGDE